MSPPIFNPDGSEVSEIVLPDGSTASEVIGPDGNVVFEAAPDIRDSAVSRWTFDDADTESGTAIDVWGDNDATINGATTGVNGANQTYATGEAYSFDGNDDYVEYSLGNTYSEISISFWVKFDDFSDRFNIVHGTFRELNAHQFSFETHKNTSTLRMSSETVSGNITVGDLNTGTWYFVGGGYSDSDGEADVVLNGTIQNTESGSGTVDMTINSRWGGRFAGSGYGMTGEIDDPRVFNKRLSATEWSNLYQTGSING